ncbi:MAG: hypothetical protein AAGA02_02320 [Bacteroidota bacterium]
MGIFRINTPANVRGTSSSQQNNAQTKFEFYLSRLIKLIPSEIIGLYLCLYTIGKPDGGYISKGDDVWLSTISVIALVCLFILRIFETKQTGFKNLKSFKTVQWGSIFISSVSFVIWLYAMGHEFAGITAPELRYIQLAVIIWTFIVPIFYKKDGS